MKFIFAQGNPDQKYAGTRHNTGFMALDAFGEEHSALWKNLDKFDARIAEIVINGEKVLLIKPLSFYNDTGIVARRVLDFYKADPTKDLLVIHDDLALPLGTIRVRVKGGDAGNNGVKSLTVHLGPLYSRIRVGIWTELRDRMDDVNFVLGRFDLHEQKKLDTHIFPHVIKLIDQFLKGTLEATSDTLPEIVQT
ncbi:MAG: aminoacyl-tRNA hydrolase [Candidatus Saccharimonadales bacterium]